VDVKVELLQKLVQNCHMFDGLTSAGMRAVCLRLRQTIILPFENVVYEGDMAADVFFLSRGRLSVVKNNKHIVMLNPGAVFGEVAVVLNQKRSAGIESVVWSEYWSLSKLEFEELCEEFTELRKWVTSKVHQHLKADLGRKKEGKQGVGLSQSCNKNCASTDTHATRCMHCLSKSLDQCHLINATCSVSLDQCHLIDA
jgi:CRP-like cAMP-binding protein